MSSKAGSRASWWRVPDGCGLSLYCTSTQWLKGLGWAGGETDGEAWAHAASLSWWRPVGDAAAAPLEQLPGVRGVRAGARVAEDGGAAGGVTGGRGRLSRLAKAGLRRGQSERCGPGHWGVVLGGEAFANPCVGGRRWSGRRRAQRCAGVRWPEVVQRWRRSRGHLERFPRPLRGLGPGLGALDLASARWPDVTGAGRAGVAGLLGRERAIAT